MSFEAIARPEIVRALNELGIEKPTDIQEKAMPAIRMGQDVIGMSRTGSGKTLAFGAPILERLVPGQGPQAMIMAPTRELVVQIARELEKFGKYMEVSIAQVYGGVGLEPQVYEMSKSEVIVATPGRMLDQLQRGNVELGSLRTVVLDEADKMVDMGFIQDVDKIIQAAVNKDQVLLFGATISEEINRLKERHMRNPVKIKAEARVKDEFLAQYYYNVKAHEKFSMLVQLLKTEDTDRSIIFCAKRSTVELVQKNLRLNGVKAEMLHGKLSQNKRQATIDGFMAGKCPVLVASAVAARGLDISNVSHVFNYDLSQDPQEYIHRVGRTARAGNSGKAITLLAPNDHEMMHAVMRNYDVNLVLLENGKFPLLKFDARGNHSSGRYGGPRRYGNRGGPRRDGPRRYGNGPRRSNSSGGRGPRRSNSSGGRGPRRSNSSAPRSHGQSRFSN